MPDPGDVVTVDFAGAVGIKRRPAVIVSSSLYHAHRPDVIVGVITSQIAASMMLLDYVVQDRAAAGLRQPSAFRAYFGTALATDVYVIGRLTPADGAHVQKRVGRALALSTIDSH